jgi:hypothetical protein
MPLPRRTLPTLSLLATMGCLSLLLADSAEESCAETPIDRTFDITTTCGVDREGRFRVTDDMQPVVSAKSASISKEGVEIVSGDIAVADVSFNGSCSGEDEPFNVSGLGFTIDIPSGAGPTGDTKRATCQVSLSTGLGKDIACTDPLGGTCTVVLTEAP